MHSVSLLCEMSLIMCGIWENGAPYRSLQEGLSHAAASPQTVTMDTAGNAVPAITDGYKT